MSMHFWKLLPFLLFLSLVMFFWRGLSLDPHEVPSAQIGRHLPEFKLPQLEANQEPFTPKVINHSFALLNVWASWCMACTQEQVFLMQLAQEGVPIYGLNYKDKAADALNWLNEWGNPYRMTGSDQKGKVSIDLGVYGAPETFLIDKQGMIRYRHTGPLTAMIWEKDFLPQIKALENKP